MNNELIGRLAGLLGFVVKHAIEDIAIEFTLEGRPCSCIGSFEPITISIRIGIREMGLFKQCIERIHVQILRIKTDGFPVIPFLRLGISLGMKRRRRRVRTDIFCATASTHVFQDFG